MARLNNNLGHSNNNNNTSTDKNDNDDTISCKAIH